jgi:hypothetical protein
MSIDEITRELSALQGRTQNLIEDYHQRIPEDETLKRYYLKARTEGKPFDFKAYGRWIKTHKRMGTRGGVERVYI